MIVEAASEADAEKQFDSGEYITNEYTIDDIRISDE